jgi:hypothetical protein
MSRDDYSQRQKARDAEYQSEYKAWIKSLPPDERRKLEAQGLAEPDVAHHGNESAKGDATDSPVMRIGNDPALLPEPEPDPESPPGPEGSQLHVPDTGPTYVSRNVPSSRSHVRNGNRSLNLPPETGQMALVPFCRPMKWPM